MAAFAVQQKTVQLSHGVTHYVEAGQGDPVIMLHGSMMYQGGIDWLPCMPQIAAKFRVLAPDFVGWPVGDTRPNLDGFPALADFVREFQDALGIESSHLVGTSMGGWVAGLVAYESPNRVGKCIQTGHNGFTTAPNAAFSNWSQPPADDEAREWILHVTRDVDIDVDAIVQAKLDRMHNPDFVAAFRTLMHRLGDGDHRAQWGIGRRLPRTKTPTLFLFGENDNPATIKLAPDLPALTPRGKVVIMNDCGHRNHIEQPGAFGKHVVDFLSEPPA